MNLTWISESTAVQGAWVVVNETNILEYNLPELTGKSKEELLAAQESEMKDNGLLWARIPEDLSTPVEPMTLVYKRLEET